MLRLRAHPILATVMLAGLICSGGCGILTARQDVFPNAETGEDGQTYTLDDLAEIANDPDLTNAERRDAFHAMGIEDEDLITALLTL